MFSTDIPSSFGVFLAAVSVLIVVYRLRRSSTAGSMEGCEQHGANFGLVSYNVVHKPGGKTMSVFQEEAASGGHHWPEDSIASQAYSFFS